MNLITVELFGGPLDGTLLEVFNHPMTQEIFVPGPGATYPATMDEHYRYVRVDTRRYDYQGKT